MSLTDAGEGRRISSVVSVHYLIARRRAGKIELLRLALHEDVLPIFSSREEAKRFLVSRAPGGGWRVRGFSGGELISLLFAFHESIGWMAPNPTPTEDDLSGAMSRDKFIEFLAG